MNERAIRKIFYRFLKEENAFAVYFKNLYGKYGKKSNKMLFDLLRECPEDLINFSLCWRETPQGEEFWEHFDAKWRKVYKKAETYFWRFHSRI